MSNMSMAQLARLWHSRTTIWSSVFALGILCGLTAAYRSLTTQSSVSGLRRSNAVHRPRRDRQDPTVEGSGATSDAPLGKVIIRHGEVVREYNLITDTLPSVDQLRSHFGMASHLIRTEMIDVALELALATCFAARSQQIHRHPIAELGLGDMVDAMALRSEDQIRLVASGLPRILHLRDVGEDQMRHAVNRFLGSEIWLEESDRSLDDGDEGADVAQTEEIGPDGATSREPSQGLRGLLYYIAEEDAKRKAYEHRGIHCEECGELPIRGVRWHCLNCPDFDLCASCETHTEHPKTHVFAKIKIPLPVLSQPTKEYRLWYPGDPRKIHAPLEPALRRQLCQEHGFDEPQLDALYDQFTCLANVPSIADHPAVNAAIDRRAFNKALTCEKWTSEAASNALYDRMFAFYDVNGNGLIEFEEFCSGFAYLRGPMRFASLRRTLQGYDIDGDGFVDRADFLRLLRAKFAIQQQLVRDSVEGQEIDQTHSAMDILRSSQPISSIFAQEEIPPGELRLPRGKSLSVYGDMVPLQGTKTILDEADSWPLLNNSSLGDSMPAHQRLRDHLSRFDELLHGDTSQSDMGAHAEGSSPLFVQAGTDDVLADGILVDVPLCGADEEDLLEPYVQDVMWQATEDGLNSLLDPLFLIKEQEDQEAVLTRDERSTWRAAVDLADCRAGDSETISNGTADKALSTSAKSVLNLSGRRSNPVGVDDTTRSYTSNMVPTDWESLSLREHSITDTSLENLLSATGYGVRTDRSAGPDPAAAEINGIPDGINIARSITTHRSEGATQSDGVDPTLPQNMPNKADDVAKDRTFPSHVTLQRTRNTTSAPSDERLRYLAKLDKVDRQLKERGGPGRLTFDEVESITVTVGSELRGLIKSWLEWASF